MKQQEKLDKALQDFHKLTGLSLDLGKEAPEDPDDTIRQIQALCSAYREANSKETVIHRWLSGGMSDEEFYLYAERMHLSREGQRGIFLIRFKNDLYPEVITLLRHLISDSKSWILPHQKDRLIIVYHFSPRKPTGLKEKAYEILDTLNTELMEQAVIACEEITSRLDQLPLSFRRTELTLEVGSVFYPDRTIYIYDELGLGSLLYNIPEDTCREYIRTNLGEEFLQKESSIFQSDILQTADCFLKNNLNIAETARQLHIHRNTLLYRLEQIQNESGLDIRKFEHSMTYKLASMILLSLKKRD